MTGKYLLGIMIGALALVSCTKKKIEKNSLNFKDDFNCVQDSLLGMQKLMRELPSNVDNFNVNYEYKNDSLIVNGIIGRAADSNIFFSNKALNILSFKKKVHFLRLVKYLSKNYMTAGYIDRISNIVLFDYRRSVDDDYNNTRVITVLPSIDTSIFHGQYKIFDKKGSTYLLAPK